MTQSTYEVYTGGQAPGGTFCPATLDALRAAFTMHKGSSAPSYKEAGTTWMDDSTDGSGYWLQKVYDGSDWITVGKLDKTNNRWTPYSATGLLLNPAEQAFTDADATPTVAAGTSFVTANTGATTITAFDDGYTGQTITVRVADANTTISSGLTGSGRTVPCVSGDVLVWYYNGSAWKQVGGSVGLGQRFVPIDGDTVGDWIASTVTSATDVDLSDDSVRKGAIAALINCYGHKTAGQAIALNVRRNGDSNNAVIYPTVAAAGYDTCGYGVVGLDDNAIFEAWFGSSWASTTNLCRVFGYWI